MKLLKYENAATEYALGCGWGLETAITPLPTQIHMIKSPQALKTDDLVSSSCSYYFGAFGPAEATFRSLTKDQVLPSLETCEIG